MSKRTDYPYQEALDDLDVFFNFHIKDHNALKNFSNILGECRAEKRVGFRFIHEELMKYRKSSLDYFNFSEREREMLEDLFYFWG